MPHIHLDASVAIHAPAQVVFDRMNDLRRFNEWNPFPSMDPTTVSHHEGPAGGPGAVFQYEGKRLGKGRMEVTSVRAPQRIDLAMTFWRGGQPSHATSAFVIRDTGGASEVHWTFDEDRSLGLYLLGKLVFDRGMTRIFGKGLETLKSLIETPAPDRSAPA